VHWGWREFQQAGLVTADTPAGRAFRRFGRGSIMAFPPGAVFGEGGIEVGEDTLIGQQVSLSAGTLPGQDLIGLTLLTIGDRCVIGRGSHIVAHQSVEISTSRVVCTRSMTTSAGGLPHCLLCHK
jgi:acetyltransferase-like isoleucine patch superfamily enzyme